MNEHSDPPDDSRADASEHRADVSETRADVAKKRADVSEKRADVSEKRADVSELRQDASDVRQDASDTRQDDRVIDIDVRFADLRHDYEEVLESSGQVAAGLEAVEEAVRADRESRERENVKRDRRVFWSRVLTLVALTIGIIGVGVGKLGLDRGADSCRSARSNREVLRELVSRTGGTIDVTKVPGFDALPPAEQDFWLMIFAQSAGNADTFREDALALTEGDPCAGAKANTGGTIAGTVIAEAVLVGGTALVMLRRHRREADVRQVAEPSVE